MAKAFDKIKKQIDTQTRPKVGSIKVETQATTYVNQPTPGDVGTDPAIAWDKVSYSRARGELFELGPGTFNDPLASKSTQMIYTNVGNFSDRAHTPYTNVRYSGWAGINNGGTISFRIIAEGSLTVYIDSLLVHTSGPFPAQPTDLVISISDRSFLQIYWYAENENSKFDLDGNISRYLTIWEQSDVTPFFRNVEWYPEEPVSVHMIGGGNVRPSASITLRWWFGLDVTDFRDQYQNDLGGFGVWQVEFQEIGEIDVMGDNISVPGYYPNARYLRINDIVYKPLYTTANIGTNSTVFAFEAHGLTDDDDGQTVEVGTMKLLRDLPIAEIDNGTQSIWEMNDADVTWGITYYYLIDSYDASPNRNRGGLTEVIQMVTAGDVVPPPLPYNIVGTRNSVDSVTLEWDQESLEDVDHWAIYTDFNSGDFSGETSSLDSVEVYGAYNFWEAFQTSPNGFLVTIENDSTNNKVARWVSNVVGTILVFTEQLPMDIATSVTVRFLYIWTGASNNEPVVPKPLPRFEIEDADALDLSRSGELSVVT